MSQLSEHFALEEFACPHCGRVRVSGELVSALEELRAMGPESIHVTSGYRCEQHNRAIGGAAASEHLTGEAADVRIAGLTLQQMYLRALRVKAFRDGGIGVYDGKFIHIDVRPRRARWARVAGEYLSIESSGLIKEV